MKPALQPDLASRLLKAALGSVFTLGTEMDTIDIQALHKVIPELLDAMLGNLLAESPDADRLHFILEHVSPWIVSRVPQERARAIKSSTALLRYTVTLPEFDISAEFPSLGHHVAQLALFVSDPDQDISRQAREGTYRLYQLLLEQRGLTIHEAEDLWCCDWHQDSRLLGYKNTARVGEVFGKFFSAGQRKDFLETAMPAIHHPLLCISQAGLLLTYAILGEAEQLLGYKGEDVTAKLMGQLRSIWQLHQVPEIFARVDLLWEMLTDIIVYSANWKEHLKHLTKVLRALGKAGLTANPAKCHLDQEEVTYLGYMVRPARTADVGSSTDRT
ncbi:maestro heat-like repeat-containing protein family member 7 [Gopherus flavomarginatus]|uniref:maestro heat-like repeat-containing protein family member 7 n=1 Tax=Gopherus flavomarginatus TaxID=286002 RepID=UPI0021CBB737|nr:maestro heat-like repeat-containing protein family member 7 [Gopherus flavomarginatus]